MRRGLLILASALLLLLCVATAVLWTLRYKQAIGRMKTVPITENVPVIRTDFSDDAEWRAVKQEIAQPSVEGFIAYVEYIDDRAFRDINAEHLLGLIPPNMADFGHPLVIVADGTTFSSTEHSLLVIDLDEFRGRSFRALPSQIQAIENNLSTFNVSFEDFAADADSDGIFRGNAKER
jgi:hypothetical protein